MNICQVTSLFIPVHGVCYCMWPKLTPGPGSLFFFPEKYAYRENLAVTNAL